MKEKIKNHKYLLLIILFSFLIALPLFRQGYITHHDDMHFIRVYEMRRCFDDLQIPCRWNPDMAYGFGQPMFNYYSVFIYYLGALLTYLFDYLVVIKLLFYISLVLSGVSMYLFVKELLGDKEGFASATLYMLAPYLAFDVYVRGAIPESFALALIPLIFYFGLRLVKKYSLGEFIGLTIFLSIFLTLHNISILITIPIFLLWFLLILYIFGTKYVKYLILSFLISFGISSFFLLPAYFEKGLVQINTLISKGFDFRAHFINLDQLFFDRTWGYGVSIAGVEDALSFQVGWPHVFLVLASLLLIVFIVVKGKRNKSKFLSYEIKKNDLILYSFFMLLFLGSSFMTHSRSTFIWERITVLWYVQFPWRFLMLTAFSASVLVGYLVYVVNMPYKKYLLFLILIAAIILNFNHFKPWDHIDITTNDKLSGELFEEQQKGAVMDYLPKTAVRPTELAPSEPWFIKGSGVIKEFDVSTDSFYVVINVDEKAELAIPVFDFPNWVVYVDDKLVEHNVAEDGTISVGLEEGTHKVSAEFENTGIRKASNIIAVASILAFVVFVIYEKNKKIRKK